MRSRHRAPRGSIRSAPAALATVLVATLLLQGASVAAAWRVPERLLEAAAEAAGVPLARVAPSFRAGAADLAGEHVFQATWRIRLPGTPYQQWDFAVTRVRGAGASFSVSTLRADEESATLEAYGWDRRIGVHTFTYSKDLRHFRIAATDGLGALGRLRLHLTGSDELRTSDEVCRRTGELLFSDRSRTGTAEGVVEFRPDLPGLPSEVEAVTARVTLSRTRFTDADCGGRERPPGCAMPLALTASDESSITDVDVLFASVNGGLAALRLSLGARTATFWMLDHLATVPPAPLDVAAGQASVSPVGPDVPFVGSLVLDEIDRFTFQHGGCRFTDVAYQWNAGTLTATFDAGDVAFTGPALQARTSVARRV